MPIVGGNRPLSLERVHHAGIVGALISWRVTQGIYRFDPDLYRAVIETPLDRELPTDHLYRLPEWCLYLETPGLTWPTPSGERPLHGFWAHLDWDQRDPARPHHELRLILDTAATPETALDPIEGCRPVPVILGQGTLAEAYARMLHSGQTMLAAQTGQGFQPDVLARTSHLIATALAPLVALLLYLCSDQPDWDHAPSPPKPVKTKNGLRWFPPSQPTTWEIGLRIGRAIRFHAANAVPTSSSEASSGASSRRAGPRAHIRRAHWHTYRIGPGRQDARLTWLPPIPVKLASPDELPATIRPVR